MACKFEEETRLRIIQCYYRNGESVTAASRHFNTWRNAQPNAAAIPLCTKKNVHQLVQKFLTKKNLQLSHKGHSGRPRSVRTEERVFDVMRELEGERKSLRQVSRDLEMSTSTVQRIARQDLHLHAYRAEKKHGLLPTDFVQRTELCHLMLNTLENTNQPIVFVDEATFRTDGTVNLTNDRFWFTRGTAPNIPPAEVRQDAQRATVLAAVSRDWLGGPYFFPGTVNSGAYQDALELFLIPDLHAAGIRNVWFVQDGATAHTSVSTRQFLSDAFGADRVISKFFNTPWPARSPDLNPVDYFLWGFARELVYAQGGFLNLHHLNAAIVRAFDWIRQNRMDAVRNAVDGFFGRLRECIENDGYHLRHR